MIQGREENNYNVVGLPGSEIHFCSLEPLERLLTHEYAVEPEDFILTDSNTRRYCLPVIREMCHKLNEDHVVTILAGEQNKSLESLGFIWKELLNRGAGRSSRMFCLGGGMITDIGGMAAATFMRGIRFINIPTSLIGMADAAIGGKTAVNIEGAKNPVGVFALPEAVLIYPGFLNTLPKDEFISGFAEIVKMSLVEGKDFWEMIKTRSADSLSSGQNNEILPLISQAVMSKVSLVSDDLRDTGIRQCLNFGHTVGHAIEELSLKKGKPVKHGIAIASGMLCESYLSVKKAGLSPESYDEIISYIKAHFPLARLKEGDIPGIVASLYHDKKKKGRETRFSLLSSPGQCRHGVACELSLVEESLHHYISNLA